MTRKRLRSSLHDEGLVRERAVLVKVVGRGDRKVAEPMAEITALANTAGVYVVEAIQQNLDSPRGATYIGKGKLQEVVEAIQKHDVDVFIVDGDLSPAQEKNLEKLTERKVVDRSQLIMDIFARRARTHQAKLQVELAQLRYNLPRLKRLWGHLSRFEGGIGMRGPGETQLETDKRLIRNRIQKLKRELDEIERRNEATILSRGRDFVISIVGYTNAGKSTLLNRLTGSNELVEDKLFATLEGRIRRWPVGETHEVLLSDTVGFIRNLPHHLVASFHATLAEVRHADLLFLTLDASSPEAERQLATVQEVLEELGCGKKPVWLILTKWDAVAPDRRVEARALRSRFPADVPVFEVSAARGSGLADLAKAVNRLLAEKNETIMTVVPHDRGDLVSYLRENGRVLSQDYVEAGVKMKVEMSPARAAKFRTLVGR